MKVMSNSIIKNIPRTNIDHTDGIHQAFFNDAGFLSWENILGGWNGITETDGELLRRVATILRRILFTILR